MLERLWARLTGSVLFWDLWLTLFALWFSSSVRLWVDLGYDLTAEHVHVPWPLYPAVALIWGTIFLILRPQRALFTSGMVEALGRLVGAVVLSSASFAGLLYLSFRDISRLQFIYFVLLNLALLLLFHLVVRVVVRMRRQGSEQHRVLVVGDALAGQQLATEFERRAWAGLKVVGYVSDQPHVYSCLPHLGLVDDLPQIVAEQQIHEAIFALPPQQHERVARLSLELLKQPVMLHMLPSVLDLTFARTPVTMIGGIPLISLRESPFTPAQRVLKRMVDLVASGLLLVLLAPLFVVLALLIKLESPGPIFFWQERIGEYGRRFRMIKFRSMYVDAEDRWHEVAHRDEHGRLIHKVSDDPRVTQIGRKLRRTSLDELPQLLNVLRGEMSLVGPRPEVPYIAAEYEPWQWQRFQVPPGITGWWQVNGRSDRTMHLHTKDDLYYIQNYSFWLDLRILLKTLRVVLRGQGAY
ncbi:sugar transferase [Candidatus Viridilinea mediisalina]|uniref:Polyprenyl glycosylphosphotransferase n=1 Tax=Candidatus Viridilinea mediisalina TaxID=2024553 RepID=A0A2A6RKF8_9CHLR|nr:sugar transferase [Candidatus Viridilinea mediisalina]PDW03594.1 polyprenyl glycosylphosphotransferase [Candidatus Viridilinea mediisalina]